MHVVLKGNQIPSSPQTLQLQQLEEPRYVSLFKGNLAPIKRHQPLSLISWKDLNPQGLAKEIRLPSTSSNPIIRTPLNIIHAGLCKLPMVLEPTIKSIPFIDIAQKRNQDSPISIYANKHGKSLGSFRIPTSLYQRISRAP